MKIIFEQQANPTRNRQQLSFARSLVKLGHECITWHSNNLCWFDMLDEQKPDKIILSDKTAKSRDVSKYLSSAGRSQIEIWRYNNSDIKICSMNSGVVFNIGALDLDLIANGDYLYRYSTDYLIITSGVSPTLIKPILALATKQPNIKIFGSTQLNTPCFCGNLPFGEIKHAFASAKIYIHAYSEKNDLFWMAAHYNKDILSIQNLKSIEFNRNKEIVTYDMLAKEFVRLA